MAKPNTAAMRINFLLAHHQSVGFLIRSTQPTMLYGYVSGGQILKDQKRFRQTALMRRRWTPRT
jgi:hypothetical protein